MAVAGDRVAGVGSFDTAWWTGQPGIYAVDVRVDPGHARQGIGTRLYDALRSRLLQQGAARLTGWVRADTADGRCFAVKLGFRETGQVVQEYRLEVAAADTRTFDGIEERLGAEGLRIASLADLGTEDTAFLQALQRLWADSGDEPPDPDGLRRSFDSWRRSVVDGAGLSPETHWVALDGDAAASRRPVGMTFLKQLSDDAFENDYTGVASTHRGRGIATALKLRALSWARGRGVRWFHTSSEVSNMAMIRINTRLGYRSGARRLEVGRDLP